jgi:hypothetical protein
MYPPKRSILDQLLNRTPSAGTLPGDLGTLLRRYSTRTWTKGGIFSLMPYTITIQ